MACGKWFALYDVKDNEACVGVFESTAEICAYFGGIKPHRVSKSVMLNYPLTFGDKRFRVAVFVEPTRKEIKRLLRQRFGDRCYKITEDGIYIREAMIGSGWRFFAQDLEEAATLLK
jgi:hypothetical protein